MAQREKGGRVVFIGNIPYGVSEEEIMQVFGDCGHVLGFRLVYDKDSGQPKGFGFLEYSDVDSAASAVKNLNNKTLHGRTLRVDYSNDNRGTTNAAEDSNRAPPPAHFNMNGPPAGARPDPSALPQLPPGIELPAGITAFDAISATLSKIDTPQLLDFISQLKNLCASNPAQANALLQSAPHLGYAVFQAMLLLGLVDTSVVTQLIASAPPPQAALPQQPPPVAQQPPPVSYAQPPPAQYPGYPPPQGYPPQPQQQMQQQYPAQYAPTPPQAQAYAPPPQAAPPAQDQTAMITQLMQLSRDQIMAMPDGTRQQIIQLRAQFGAPI